MSIEKQPIFDGHHDSLTRPGHEDLAGGKQGGHLDLPRAAQAGLVASFWAIWCEGEGTVLEPEVLPGGGYDEPLAPELGHDSAAAQAGVAAGRLLGLERKGALRVVRGTDDIARSLDDGIHAAIMHLEGAEPIDPELESLDFWYSAGLRSIGPVWSRSNAFADGVRFVFPSGPDTGGGLTEAGRNLVAGCNRLGILVDVSHLTEKGFFDVVETTDSPVVATHCGAHAIAPASRNLTDDQLGEIGRSNGIVGIPYIVDFIRDDGRMDSDTPLSTVVAHVRHVADLIGVEHVGLGSDFDGGSIPDELGDVTGLPRLLDELATAGFDPDEVEAIAWGNWNRVIGQTMHGGDR